MWQVELKHLTEKCLYTHSYGHALNHCVKGTCNECTMDVANLSRSHLKGKVI